MEKKIKPWSWLHSKPKQYSNVPQRTDNWGTQVLHIATKLADEYI